MPIMTERRLDQMSRAVMSGRIIPYLAAVLGAITLLAALAVRLFARGEFTSFGESVWWAAQTVTTVGYGDVVPTTPFSQVVAVIVMLLGVAAASLITAVITSVVITVGQKRHSLDLLGGQHPEGLHEIHHRLEALERIEQRLLALERRLDG